MTSTDQPARRSRPWLLAALLFAGILIAATSGVALAHANLARSDPPAGASLPAAPDHVQLWFTEGLEPSFSQIVVYDANGQRVDRGDSRVTTADEALMTVSLAPNLPEGWYAIAWKAQSRVDGHITSGMVPFGVGVGKTPVLPTLPASVTAGSVSGSPLEMVLRWLTLLSAIAFVGAFAFWVVQIRPSASSEGELAREAIVPAQRLLAMIAWIIFVSSNVAFILEQASVAADVPLLGALGKPFVELLTTTQYGRLWGLRMVLAGLLGALLFYRWRARERVAGATLDRLGLVAGAVLLLEISLTSHSASVGSLTPLGIMNDWLHLSAAAVWIGGLLQLTVLLASTQEMGGHHASRAPFLGLLASRFGLVGGFALAVLGVTGLLEALFHVGTLGHLLDNGYGQALLLKLLLIVPLVTIAAANHFVILPVLLRGRAVSTAAMLAHVRAVTLALSWTVRLEVVFAVGVIAVVGVMTSLSPPQQVSTAGAAGPLTLRARAGDLTVALAVSPGRPGPNRYAVDVRDGKGQAATDVELVRIRFSYLDRDLGVAEAVLSSDGRGRFEGESRDLAVVGRWLAEVLVRRTGRDDLTATFGYEVTPEGARALQSAQLEFTWGLYAGFLLALMGCAAIAYGIRQRSGDRRKAMVMAIYGICVLAIGAWLAFRDVQQAQAQASAKTLALMHPATPQSIAAGAAAYRQNCLLCHGPGGQGDGPRVPTLTRRPSSLLLHVPLHRDTDLAGWIADGFPGSAMPPFRHKLTEQQRWDVLNYIKSLVNASPVVTLAQNAGPTLVTLTVDPAGSGPNQLLATLQDLSGTLVMDAQARIRSQSLEAVGRAEPSTAMVLADGVYQASMNLAPAGRWRLEVVVARPGQAESGAVFDLTLPAPGAGGAEQLLLLVDQTMNQLRSVVENNQLTSGGPVVTTRYEYQRPDRMHFQVRGLSGESESYVLATKRFDRVDGGPWEARPFPGTEGFRWPQYGFDKRATEVTVVDQELVDNVECEVVSFLEPLSGGRYRLWVGTQDHRLHKYVMMATGHYMTSTFSGFDEPLNIEPPIAGPGR